MTKKAEMTIFVISDSIGETGELIAKACARQFGADNYDIRRFPYHNKISDIEPIFAEAERTENALIIYTSVEEETRNYIKERTKKSKLDSVDVMGEPMDSMQKILGRPPLREPGLIRRLDENYFRKVEAIEFAVKYDDGKDPRGVRKADLCLLGISRTSKTPLSMYLANKNFKVANVPLVPEIPVPPEVYSKDARYLIGLTAKPEKLIQIREERLKALGLGSSATYASIDRIREEINYSNEVFKSLGCKVIDISNKAIEETAGIVLDYLKSFEK